MIDDKRRKENVHRSPSAIHHSPFTIHHSLFAGVFLALLTAAFFWQILFTQNAWMPAGGGDLLPFLYPNYHFAAQSLQNGIIPLWNPHLYSGIPFAADAQSGLFYPPNLLIFLLSPNLNIETLEYLAVFHFWLAGFGMFLFLQHSPLAAKLRLHPLAALTGAIAFEFSDLFIVHFGNLNMIAVAAWLPLVMLAFQNAVAQRKTNFALTAGALLAIATLASHIQITLFILLALGPYALWEVFWPGQAGPSSDPASKGAFLPPSIPPAGGEASIRARFAPLGYLFLTLLVTVGLSALWLIPTLEMSRYTLRATLSYPESAAYSLHPAQLIGLLIPNYFGRDPALHWGPWERVETGYIGILTLLLALVGASLQKDRQTCPEYNRRVRFFIALAGVGFLLALGDSSILHGWLSLSPGFGQFRAPARYILLLDFSLATLAAIGLHRLMETLNETARKTFSNLLKTVTWILGALTVVSLPLAYYALLVTQDRNPDIFGRAQAATNGVVTFAVLLGVSLTLLHLAKNGKLRGAALGVSAVVIIGLDLFSLGANVDVGHSNPAHGFDHPQAIAFLQNDGGINRLEVTTDVWHLWQPNTALLNDLYDVWGLYNPLTLADTTRYWRNAMPRSSAAYNLLGPKYIVASKAGAPADGDIVPVFDADPDINIYLNRAVKITINKYRKSGAGLERGFHKGFQVLFFVSDHHRASAEDV
jgi:multisubunit Na+/H+ antiporter MnhG subunit